jgi:spermidine synthase
LAAQKLPKIAFSGAKSIRLLSPRACVALLFFCSGTLALIYEVLWLREFAFVFGSSGPATAAVLAAYFTGLGLGSQCIGARVRYWSRPLRAYAVLEVLVGVGAVLAWLLLLVFSKWYPSLFAHLASKPVLFLIVKSVLAFSCLLLPTFCMGGTLPVLAQFTDKGQVSLGVSAGGLYALNTAGAALGALAVPFVLLPKLGTNGTLVLAFCGNVIVALVAWSISVPASEKSPKRAQSESSAKLWNATLFHSFLSGLSLFALQVLWNRAFAQVHENSIYSFAVMVAVFIFALATGAECARLSLRRGWSRHLSLGGVWIIGAVLTMLSPWVFLRLTHQLSYISSGGRWSNYGFELAVIAMAAVFIPITLMGMAFPLLMERIGKERPHEPAQAIGRLLAANILGSVIGALLAGFCFPRLLGLWNSVFFIAGGLLMAGCWQICEKLPRSSRWTWGVLTALVGSGAFWFCTKADLPRVKLASFQGERLIAISEGAHGITAVVERPNSRRLKLNNHYVLGGTSSVGDERMQAHIPLLLHPQPRRVAFLGLGTGITAGGALFHPLEKITVVELVPEVVSAARTYFREANAAVLDDPKTTIVLDDARNFLRGTSETFDVLVGDLVVPWREGEGALFTLEHFIAARNRLNPGGLFCVWLPCFQLSEEEFAILARTFLTVFPEALVWRADFSPISPALGLIGFAEAAKVDLARVRSRIEELRPDPSNPQLADAMGLWMQFMGSLDRSDLATIGSDLNRQNQPLIELLGPRQHAGNDRSKLLIGRRLQNWTKNLRDPSANFIQLSSIENSASSAGNLLFEFTLLISEGRESEARAVQEQIRILVPQRFYQNLFP